MDMGPPDIVVMWGWMRDPKEEWPNGWTLNGTLFAHFLMGNFQSGPYLGQVSPWNTYRVMECWQVGYHFWLDTWGFSVDPRYMLRSLFIGFCLPGPRKYEAKLMWVCGSVW